MMKVFFLILLLMGLNEVRAKTIVFLGDSLTEGYQLAKEEAYPHLIEQEFKRKKYQVKIINAGESGATSASGPKKIKWYLKAKPEILVLALGANDGLRGLSLKETEKNLSLVIETALAQRVRILLVGMKMPVNYGEPYRTEFFELFKKLSIKYKLDLVPFLLEGVGGVSKLNLPDGIHPNPDGHKIMAKTVLKKLEPLL
jgi:acyl-CoA thioesterase-1